jgi:hypothetical protein
MSLKRTRWIRVTVEEDKKALLRKFSTLLPEGRESRRNVAGGSGGDWEHGIKDCVREA